MKLCSTPFAASRSAHRSAFVAACLALAACAPPRGPEQAPGGLQPTAAAAEQTARTMRDWCPGNGEGRARLTFDPRGFVSKVHAEALPAGADQACIEAAFRRARVEPFNGNPMDEAVSFTLDMTGPAPAPLWVPVMGFPNVNMVY